MKNLKSIAKELGVSTATVSNALNGTGRVSPKLREKILKFADERNYRPSLHARVLHGHRLKILGLIISTIRDNVANEILSGAEQAASKFDYHILITTSGGDREHSVQAVDQFDKLKIGGILHLQHSNEEAKAVLNLSSRLQLPYACMYRNFASKATDGVVIDHIKGYGAAIMHLLSLNHKKIALVHGDDLENSDIWRLADPIKESINISNIELCNAGLDDIVQLAKKGITGFVCDSDDAGNRALGIFNEHQINVPNEVSVIGYRDILPFPTTPLLTTMRVPFWEIGFQAATKLLKKMEQEAPSSTNNRILSLEPELIIRNSTSVNRRT